MTLDHWGMNNFGTLLSLSTTISCPEEHSQDHYSYDAPAMLVA
jgi:hypothetical protein